MAASDAAAQRDAQQQFRNQAIQGLGSAIQGGIGLAGEFGGGTESTSTTDTTTTGTSLPPTGTVGTGTYEDYKASMDSGFMTFDEWKQQGN